MSEDVQTRANDPLVQSAIGFDGFVLEPGRGRLLGRDGAEISLRSKAFELLVALTEAGGRPLEKAKFPKPWKPRGAPLRLRRKRRRLGDISSPRYGARGRENRWENTIMAGQRSAKMIFGLGITHSGTIDPIFPSEDDRPAAK